MKRWIQTCVLCIALAFPLALAADVPFSSGERASDVVIKPGGGLFFGILIITDGTNNVQAELYDNRTSASGTKLCNITVTGSNYYGGFAPPHPIQFKDGLYLDLTGTAATAIVYYK